jgi:hypothetical protein
MAKHQPLALGMALKETLIACKNGEILVMRTWLGATAGGV